MRKPKAEFPATPQEAVRAAVEERGEMALTLDGTRMVLRPSYEAIVAFEASTGKGLLELSRDALNGKLRLGEMAQIATACIRAWGRETKTSYQAVDPQRIGELIHETTGGVLTVSMTLSAMLAQAVTGGFNTAGELKPATTMTTNEAPVAG